MKYTEFDERRFRNSVNRAMKSVERILEVQRNPRLAEDVEHTYENKYDLANKLTNTLIIAQMNVLEQMGVTADIIKSLENQTKTSATTLRFQASESCTFLKEQTVAVPISGAVETEEESTSSGGTFFGSTKKSTISKVVHQIKEYHWKVEVHWELTIFVGSDATDEVIPIQSRSSSVIIVIQSSKSPPLPSTRKTHSPIDLPLTWLLKMIDIKTLTTKFVVDTQNEATKTPYRNRDIEQALDYSTLLIEWAEGINDHFQSRIEHGILSKHNPVSSSSVQHNQARLRSITASDLFCPIQPIFEELPLTNGSDEDVDVEKKPDNLSILSLMPVEDDLDRKPILPDSDIHKLLNEQVRTIAEATSALQKAFPAKLLAKVLSAAEATVFLMCLHIQDLVTMYVDSMGYLETMLQDQLIAAIGKRIQQEDMDLFVKFQSKKLLRPAPVAFCHSIRRDADHYPDGHISIEFENHEGKREPIHTIQRLVASKSRLQLPLSATTTCELSGNGFLHGWVQHRFEMSHKSYQLIARARQFSSFILVIGAMVGPNKMEPTSAIIVQNKDELLIPLILKDLPTPKEFKDAIKSLSPEQQDFCRAFRSMQLESSVFGLCIVQVKPQLETLLALPHDSLVKEMKLTQDLMELFVEYQVPSDLLSYEGSPDASVKEKIATVKGHVQAVMEVIGHSKVRQLEDATMRADMAVEERIASDGNRFTSYDAVGCEEFEGFSGREPLRKARLKPNTSRSFKTCSTRSASSQNKSRRSARVVAEPTMRMAMTMAAVPSPGQFSSLESAIDTRPVAEAVESIQSEASTSPVEGPTLRLTSGSEELVKRVCETTNDLVDFTLIPKLLDSRIDQMKSDDALRSTIIKAAHAGWTRYRQENLLTKTKKASTLYAEHTKTERNQALDLLEALSRSGSLPIASSEFHVIVSITHCFDNDVMGTVVQDNINPIEKLEKPLLLMASTIHGDTPLKELLGDPSSEMLQRLEQSLPTLFLE